MKWRVVLLFALTCTPFWAQFADLATTDDGGQLYFSSPMRLRGSSQNFYWKIFRYVGGKFQLFREEYRQPPDPSTNVTNFFQLTAPQVSGDGTVVAYTGTALCTSYSPQGCMGFVLSNGVIVGIAAPPGLGDGEIRLSANKRYALMINGSLVNSELRLIDLATGKFIMLLDYARIGDSRQAFADDGSVLLFSVEPPPSAPIQLQLQPVFWNAGSTVKLNFSKRPVAARVSRNKSKIVYESVSAEQRTLVAFDVASGTETALATAPGSTSQYPSAYFSPWITNDGKTVLFKSPDAAGVQQAFLVGIDASNLRQITNAPEGISEATLSGYGNVAYAATQFARLLRIDTASGVSTELSPPSSQIFSISTPAAGSLAQLSGRALEKATAVYVNGASAPLYSVSDTALVFQIPWETSTSAPAVLRVQDRQTSSFEAGITASVAAISPAFLPLGSTPDDVPLALHQDWRSLVSDQNPAVQGEVIHVYLTGMGPVSGAMQTGVPAPLSGPPQSVLNSYTCTLNFATIPPGTDVVNAHVLFAGLAPGLAGLYQLDLRIPQIPAAARLDTPVFVECNTPPATLAATEAYARLPVARQAGHH